ncbi:Ig-like domain-containing protein [Brevibacillus sp. FIR094]|uniref:Ig-like domain-containing protein n=1 Tax=Brevibacillus sp. FIR094 TaxID=3134809 RepID=UPI003D2167B9
MPPLTPALTVNVAGNFTDPDGDPLTFMIYSMTGSPATATLSASGILEFSRFPNNLGTVTVTIVATDAKGATASSSFKVILQ